MSKDRKKLMPLNSFTPNYILQIINLKLNFASMHMQRISSKKKQLKQIIFNLRYLKNMIQPILIFNLRY